MTPGSAHRPSARSRSPPDGLAYSIPSIALSALLHAILQAYVRLQAKSISPFCNFSVITYVFFFINLVVFLLELGNPRQAVRPTSLHGSISNGTQIAFIELILLLDVAFGFAQGPSASRRNQASARACAQRHAQLLHERSPLHAWPCFAIWFARSHRAHPLPLRLRLRKAARPLAGLSLCYRWSVVRERSSVGRASPF